MTTHRNWPTATEEQWAEARQTVYRAAVRAGFDPSTADDMAQNAMIAIGKRRYKTRSPVSPVGGARVEVRNRRRFQWWPLMSREQARRFRSDMTEQERAAELATMAIYRQRSGNLTPDEMASRADGWTPEQRAMAMRRADAGSVLDALLASQGIGPSSCTHEAGHTPSISGSRRRAPLPTAGADGLHTACDPVPGSHARAAADVARHHADAASR